MKKTPLRYVRPAARQAVLLNRRNLKMARSAHAYVRGSTVKFYEWLDAADRGAIPQGPPVWICGDCHLSNLGPVSDGEGHTEIQIRDLDQTVIGNPAHDLIRLGLSLATAARGSDLPGVTTAEMLEQMIGGYSHGLETPDHDDASGKRPEPVHLVMKRALRRKWKHLARERIEDVQPTIPLGKRFWPLSGSEKRAITTLFANEDLRRVITASRSRDPQATVEVLDAAYWVKGCSSLGRLRFAVLIGVGDDAAGRNLSLIDIKEAVRAAAPRDKQRSMPKDNAERVVEGARHLAPHLGERMLAARFLENAVFIRELLPQDLALELDRLERDEAIRVARFLAKTVGHAHARQMDAATRQKWLLELGRNRSKKLDAPSWLWSSVVDLVAAHEAAYLQHCRAYALDAQRSKR